MQIASRGADKLLRHPPSQAAVLAMLFATWPPMPNGIAFALSLSRPKAIPPGEHRSTARLRRAERGIWQRRFWEHTIRDDLDYTAHMDYVHFNPVKHGFVTSAAAWPYSTFRRCLALGLYPADWAGGQAMVEGGERS
jgi:hypothetical protein